MDTEIATDSLAGIRERVLGLVAPPAPSNATTHLQAQPRLDKLIEQRFVITEREM
jgi:hypothetical protein